MPNAEVQGARNDSGETCFSRDFDRSFDETAFAKFRLSPDMDNYADPRGDAATQKELDLTQLRFPAHEGISRPGV